MDKFSKCYFNFIYFIIYFCMLNVENKTKKKLKITSDALINQV